VDLLKNNVLVVKDSTCNLLMVHVEHAQVVFMTRVNNVEHAHYYVKHVNIIKLHQKPHVKHVTVMLYYVMDNV
jgi:hypothetical protein